MIAWRHQIFILAACMIAVAQPASSQVQQDQSMQVQPPTYGDSTPAAPVERNYLKEGVGAYNAGKYREAIGLLGTALSSDFNNAVLHYYMANCYVHLKQNESAIREFRIAYALEPEKEVGKFSRQALLYMGATEEKDSEPKPVRKAPPPPPRDKAKDQALDQLRKQAGLASGPSYSSNQQADDQRRQQDHMDRMRRDLMDQWKFMDRRGRVHQLPLPYDALTNLSQLRSIYDRQNTYRMQHSQQKSQEVQRSAQNLESLLNEKPRKDGPRLVPHGTNLYIRNYESTKKPAQEQ